MMEKILGTFIKRCCLVYFDDILIFEESIEKLLGNLEEVLERVFSECRSI
jgi:hypothetical protein